MCLRTEYNGSVFEEELKLIGHGTEPGKRLSPALVSSMIGQYLEKRIN